MQANIAALTQSAQNATNGTGILQTADGAYSQVSALLNRAVTLATEASNGNLSTDQSTALDTEFKSIQTEINQIGSNTNFNGRAVFSATASTTFISDGTNTTNNTISTNIPALTSLGLLNGATGSATSFDLTNNTDAQTALTAITGAIDIVSAQRGDIGASINRLTAASNVISSQVQNLTSASNGIMNADVGKTVANMTQYNVLQSTGMAALQQANQAQQSVLKLLQ